MIDEHKDSFSALTKIGGPVDSANVDEWKQGLLKEKNNWRIVERGADGSQTLIPIWKLFENHEDKLVDYQNIHDVFETEFQIYLNHRKVSLKLQILTEKYKHSNLSLEENNKYIDGLLDIMIKYRNEFDAVFYEQGMLETLLSSCTVISKISDAHLKTSFFTKVESLLRKEHEKVIVTC